MSQIPTNFIRRSRIGLALSTVILFSVACDFLHAQESAEVAPFVSIEIDSDRLEGLLLAAKESHSDAVIVIQNGERKAEWYSDTGRRPIETMSVLKSIVSLGMGRLLYLEKIDSLDQKVCEFYPEWNQGQKKLITIRHLLNHTSGLQNNPNAGVEIYPSPDAIQLALAAEVTEAPGTVFRYNNKATNLLSGIIEKASGQRMDRFLEKELFVPLGIGDHKWYYDESGSPHAMAGLELHAEDLCKFGQLVLDKGTWGDDPLISSSYIDELLSKGQPHYPRCGLLWWRIPAETKYSLDEKQMTLLHDGGVPNEDLELIRPLVGRVFTQADQRDQAVQDVLGSDWQNIIEIKFGSKNKLFRTEYGEFVGFYCEGYLGQWLVVVPKHKIVAVRMVGSSDSYDPKTDAFDDFCDRVLRLVE